MHGVHPPASVQRLDLDTLLGSPEVLQQDTDTGRPAVDVGALGAALQQRYREQEQDSRRCAHPHSVGKLAQGAKTTACSKCSQAVP